MRPIRKRRLQLVILLVVGVGVATVFALLALRQNINLFYTPMQIVNGEAPVGREIMAGGLVVPGSLKRDQKGGTLHVEFKVTDKKATVPVEFEGILPDLFREGKGIVAIGKLNANGVVIARQVLAKHDENYMPPPVKRAMEKAIRADGHPANID